VRRVLAALSLLGAVALLVGGCGGSSEPPLTKTEYVKQMKTIGRSLSSSINSVASVTSPKDAATALGKVQDDLRNAADQMKKISPPENIQDQHEKLTQAVYDFADQLDPIIDKLSNGNLAALAGVTTLQGFRDLQTAAGNITKAGYKING
jgi:nitrate/nitrite-specific signal transduction histidine kinase